MSQLLATLMMPAYNWAQYILQRLSATWSETLNMEPDGAVAEPDHSVMDSGRSTIKSDDANRHSQTRMNGLDRTRRLREQLGIHDKEPQPVVANTGRTTRSASIKFLKDTNTRAGTHFMSVDRDIEKVPFFKLDDTDLVEIFRNAFEPELEQLKKALPTAETGLAVTPGNLGPHGLSPSRLLYGHDFAEINRSIVGVLALKWLINRDYDTFSQYQERDRIDRDSFEEMREFVLGYLDDAEELYALIVATIVNDLGKDKGMVNKITINRRRGSTAAPNHDEVMWLAAEQGQIPIVTEFPEDKKIRKALLLGLEFGAKLNVPQFIQAENVPGSLEAVFLFKNQPEALHIKFLEILFDVAGAAGHRDARCALMMTKFVWKSYHATGNILMDILQKGKSLREGYDDFLQVRSKILSKAGFKSLDVKSSPQRALLRLLTIGRVTDQPTAEVFEKAFDGLSEDDREWLVKGLSVDGTDDGTAIIPYYAPAIFANTLRHFSIQEKDAITERERKEAKKSEGIAALFRFLRRVYAGTEPKPEAKQGLIVECDLEFAQEVVVSDEFKADPDVLDKLEVPAGSYSFARDVWV